MEGGEGGRLGLAEVDDGVRGVELGAWGGLGGVKGQQDGATKVSYYGLEKTSVGEEMRLKR